MTDTVIVALIGVAGTLLGATGGAYLSNKNALKHLDATRKFAVQDSARALIVTALVAAREWSAAAMGASMAVATAQTQDEVDKYLRDDFADSYTGEQIREQGATFSRAVTEAEMLLSGTPLRKAVGTLRSAQSNWWAQVIDPSIELRKHGADKVERLRPWIRFEAEFRAALANVEVAASDAMGADIE